MPFIRRQDIEIINNPRRDLSRDCGWRARACPGALFIKSAVEHPNGTVTFPLHKGLSGGKPVFYVITDASDGSVAQALGVNTSQKLANAANSAAVEKVSTQPDGTFVFSATVNFSPTPGFALTPGPAGFPPATANPPAVGEPGYSPLI